MSLNGEGEGYREPNLAMQVSEMAHDGIYYGMRRDGVWCLHRVDDFLHKYVAV